MLLGNIDKDAGCFVIKYPGGSSGDWVYNVYCYFCINSCLFEDYRSSQLIIKH
jgi:hypothetical protein